jgi:hypothetical protein
MKASLFFKDVGLRLLVGLAVVVSCAITASAQNNIIFDVDAEWKFLSPDGALDDPGDFDPDFDSTWFTPGYDDSDWESERGPFEYGGIGGFAGLDPFPGLWEPADGDRYTNYFRHEFNTSRAYSDVGVEILADDGAVIYLDGAEMSRYNCCATPEDDYLSLTGSGGNEGSFATIIFPDDLPPGDHLLAVSVHQSSTTSSDLGFGLRLASGLEPPPPPAGIDTYVTQSAKSGADGTYAFDLGWEWDGEDGGGENHGLLWFDISPEELAGFGDGKATLQLTVDDSGSNANVHRMTEDWLTAAPDGNVSWNSIPGGPGVVPGQNTEETMSFRTGDMSSGNQYTFDVTADLLAWASGVPNYGWGFVPTGTGGLGVTSFQSSTGADHPQLILEPGDPVGPELQAGDANMDLQFDQLDLVQVQIAAKYLTGAAATWGEGDWDGAPGGSPGNPPAGDGFFNQGDVVAALTGGWYLKGPYAALAGPEGTGDGNATIVYDATTGAVGVEVPGTQLTAVNITSAAGIFTGDPAEHLAEGGFDNDTDENIFKSTFGSSFGSLDFGKVAQTGLSEDFVTGDLTVIGALAGGGGLGAVDLRYIPEPSSLGLLALGLVGGLLGRATGCRRRRRS